MRQVFGPGALGRPRGIRWRGRWEGGSGWGIHVNPWLIHVNVWQKPLQCCKVISLQLKKKKKKKKVRFPLFSKLCPLWPFLSSAPSRRPGWLGCTALIIITTSFAQLMADKRQQLLDYLQRTWEPCAWKRRARAHACSVQADSSVTPRTAARQAPLSLGFLRQEY